MAQLWHPMVRQPLLRDKGCVKRSMPMVSLLCTTKSLV